MFQYSRQILKTSWSSTREIETSRCIADWSSAGFVAAVCSAIGRCWRKKHVKKSARFWMKVWSACEPAACAAAMSASCCTIGGGVPPSPTQIAVATCSRAGGGCGSAGWARVAGRRLGVGRARGRARGLMRTSVKRASKWVSYAAPSSPVSDS